VTIPWELLPWVAGAVAAALLMVLAVLGIVAATRWFERLTLPQPVRKHGRGIEAFVIAIFSLIAFYVPVSGLVLSIAAVLLGLRSLRTESREFAIAATSLGSIGLVLSALGFVISLAGGLGGLLIAPAPP
jgi:hypothetical protein